MTQQHPITPPSELIQKWSEQFEAGRSLYAMFEDIYRAGADAELEACCEWLDREGWSGESRQLRATRRPKPPSLKEQALEIVRGTPVNSAGLYSYEDVEIICRALEQLDD
jgi:hypothetical protein